MQFGDELQAVDECKCVEQLIVGELVPSCAVHVGESDGDDVDQRCPMTRSGLEDYGLSGAVLRSRESVVFLARELIAIREQVIRLLL